jgi:hypothetical protein
MDGAAVGEAPGDELTPLEHPSTDASNAIGTRSLRFITSHTKRQTPAPRQRWFKGAAVREGPLPNESRRYFLTIIFNAGVVMGANDVG